MRPILLIALIFSAFLVTAAETNNTELIAVPAPGKMEIDGALDDWDLSGSILSCSDTGGLRDIASARTSAMYDADGLYLACRWTDPTPMQNPTNPVQSKHGWEGDCLQLRVLTDTQLHVTTWYYTTGNLPVMDVHSGPVTLDDSRPQFNDGISGAGAKMAFKKNADGKGYVQEMFLPWRLLSLSGKAYKATETFKFGLDFIWSGTRPIRWADVVSGPAANRLNFWQDANAWGTLRLSPTGKLSLPVPSWEIEQETRIDLSTYGVVDMAYQLPADGNVTLVIEDEHGKRVRNLIGGYPRKQGENVEHWDGLDDRGKAVAAGSYRWHGLFSPGVDVRYQLHLFPHTNPPWRNSKGTGGWGADHSAPAGVAADDDRVYLIYPGAEGGSATLACDYQGTKLWGHGGAFQGGGTVCASDGHFLYYGGRSIDSGGDIIRVLDAATGQGATFSNKDPKLATGFAKEDQVLGLAAGHGRLYVSCLNKNKVRGFDLASAKNVCEFDVPSPRGLAIDAAGSLLVCSADAVLRVDPATGSATPLITSGLKTPRGLAVGKDGLIHVVNAGTHQILSFSSDGKTLVRQTGVAGGRLPVGQWNRDGLLNPAAVGVDREGNLWVSEDDPVAKRLSRWDTQGKNIGEWNGPSPYGGDGIVDHIDRSRIYCAGLEFKSDWKTGQSQPAWTHLRGPSQGQPLSAELIATGTFWHRQGFTTTYRGNDYLCFDYGLICVKRGQAWVPAASIGNVKTNGDHLVWSDRNDDGKVQDDEIMPLTQAGDWNTAGAGGWGVLWSRKDLSLTHITSKGAVVRFTPAAFTKGGAPIFDEHSIGTVNLPVWGGNGGPVDVDDDVMVSFYEDSHAPSVKALYNHPLGDMSGIKAYNRAGELLWTYPQPYSGVHGSFKAPRPKMPGEVLGTIYIMGVADMGEKIGKVLCFNGYYGQRFLFTTDGLFIGSIFRDSRSVLQAPEKAEANMLMNEMGPDTESYAGTFSRNNNGEVYLTGPFAGPMCVVMKIEGLDQVQRLPGGKIQMSAELAQRGLAEHQQRQAASKSTKEAPKRAVMVKASRKIDGDLSDWDLEQSGVSIDSGEGRRARAAISYDDKSLYICFDVKDPSPWKNSGDDAKTIFLYGDSVDVQLGLGAKADPRRTAPAAGDTRIVIASRAGKNVAMLYQPVVENFKGERVPFVSPVGRVEMDRVAEIAGAIVTVKVGSAGYIVEAAIPLSELGLAIPAGTAIRGDFGVLYSNELGTDCVLRSYWSNRDTNITNDLPSESRLQPNNWGTIQVK